MKKNVKISFLKQRKINKKIARGTKTIEEINDEIKILNNKNEVIRVIKK